MAFEFTDQNFETEALQEGNIAVVDFWAEWCGPCRLVSPVIDELSKEYSGNVKIGKLNVDHNPQVTTQYGVRGIPTILFLKDGKVVEKHVGTATKATLKAKIEALI
ncbi:MAG: thioredoxin [Saprospiraceae bacterium]|jgi:thioredoxin 1|nr:thioredoxin [Saprospiraceae bacterium]MBK7796824.1 thioredoxin [Saprospiraceae bacterium]MBL0259797.1 thioredoxin [Saprospiraceae bacterium]MBX7162223.1 thioredoxin [Saprospiraceae bacterium]HMS28590.1 thioredoxin [Saprospiraceae bacterium]